MSELENNANFSNTELPQQQRGKDVYGMFQTVTSAPTKKPVNWFNQIQILMTTGATRTAAAGFTTGQSYKITVVGTTDFTLIGAASSTVGVSFVATGAGSGSGEATLNLSTLYWYDTTYNTWAYVTQSNLI